MDAYDLTLILDTAVEEDQRARILDGVADAIDNQGELLRRQAWGTRTLAYEIGHRTDAEYHLFQFRGPRELLEQFARTLAITDGVVRHRVIKLAPTLVPGGADAVTEAPAA